MTTVYGVTPEGFRRKTESEIVESVERRQLATIAEDLDVSAESLVGQMNGVMSRELGLAWEQLEKIYKGYDPESSVDDMLESLAKLTGTTRRPSEPSLVLLQCTFTGPGTLEAGVHKAAVAGDPENLWTPVEDFVAPSAGQFPVMFRSVEDGAITANLLTVTVIHVPANGWSAVTNEQPASPGYDTDSDETLRLRREQQLSATGSRTIAAIRSNLVDVSNVQSAEVLENITDFTNADGIPPHSIEVIVYDGSPAAVENDEIAQVIFDSKSEGIATYGNESGTATDDAGETHTINFTRPVDRDVYLTITVTLGTGYVGDDELKDLIASAANNAHQAGDNVISLPLRCFALEAKGVIDAPALLLGFSAAPADTSNLVIEKREIARFDPSRIVVIQS